MATLEEIAKKINLSPSTISRILNTPNSRTHIYSEATKKRVFDAVREMGYQPNLMARSFRTRKSYTIGFLASSLGGPVAQLELEEMERLLAERGYRIFLGFTRDKPELEDAYFQEFNSRKVEGIILAFYERDRTSNSLRRLIQGRMPIVAVGPMVGLGVSYVDVDRAEGAYQLVRHLVIDHQYKEVAFFGADSTSCSIIQRFEGYERALAEAGIAVDEKMIFYHHGMDREKDVLQMARSQFDECLKRLGRLPKAIFASNDQKAIAVMREMKRRGYRVPEDAVVVGFDGIDIGAELPVSLTTVRQPREQISQEVVKLLLNFIENNSSPEPKSVILKPELLIRESCGCK